MRSTKQRALAATACALAMVGFGGAAAQAGEITGNGEYIHGEHFVQGKSECAFSGQNDDFHILGTTFPRVQSFGQGVSQDGPMGGVPGFACNPSGHR